MAAALAVRSARELPPGAALSADVVVVGSGAGGAMAARQLQAAGLDVVLLEAGGDERPATFTQREGDMLPRLFQDAGGRASEDGAVNVLGGRCIGGSTVHNTNLCKRAPAEVLARWVRDHGAAGWSAEELGADYAAVEAELGVAPLAEADLNRNNAILRRGVERLGWRGAMLSHNRRGCMRSGFCELGCLYDAKMNAQRVLVPDALRLGCRVLCHAQVTEVLLERPGWLGRGAPRAAGVIGVAALPGGRRGVPFRVRARAVCLAGSAIGTAALAAASGLPDPHGVRGRGLRLHPGVAVAGLFDDPVEGWRGIPQSYECTEKLSFAEGAEDRCWIVPAFAHPGGYAALVPGFGAEHAALMAGYARTAVVSAMLHDETAGAVDLDGRGRPRVRYALSERDARALLRGVRACGEILLAAGARQVMVPLARPLLARRPEDLGALERHRYRPLDPLLTSVHPMGTMPLGSDPRRAATDPGGRHHQVRGLYVADGSLFPTSLGGPPQLTIYAAGRKVARTVAADLR